MIPKSDFIKKIDTVLKLKENLIPLVSRHIPSALSFSSLKPADKSAILEKFQAMATKQADHIETLVRIRDEISKGEKNAY